MESREGKRKLQRVRKAPRVFVAMMMAFGVSALYVSISGPASATDPTYAKVTGHASFSNESNNPKYWGDNCEDVGVSGVDSYVLPAGTYTKVVVKAGSGEFANTIFAEPPKAGETVWADTNGNNTYDPGGQDGDKQVSHIIVCKGEEPPPPEKTKVQGDVTFNEGSVACVNNQVVYTKPTYVVAGNEHVVYDTARGSHTSDFGQTVTVKATGVDDSSKYELTGQTTWTKKFGDKPAAPSNCGTVVPPTQEQCPRGTEWVDSPPYNGVIDSGECHVQVVPPPHPKPKPKPPHETPAVADTSASTSLFPWMSAGTGVAALLLMIAAALQIRGRRRGQEG